jgi:hypothetical protein
MASIGPDLEAAVKMASRLLPRSLPDLPDQWRNPADVLSVLLLLGGDVVQTALAQLSGGPYGICPVAFSFGWAAFALNAVLTSLDDWRILPRPDKPSIVMQRIEWHKPTQSIVGLGLRIARLDRRPESVR